MNSWLVRAQVEFVEQPVRGLLLTVAVGLAAVLAYIILQGRDR